MIEDERRTERHKQVEAIKSLGRSSSGRGLLLNGLWACRMAAGLTQRDLAEKVGTSQGTIHELERLVRGAYPKTVRRLCVTLDVEPVDLLCAGSTEDAK